MRFSIGPHKEEGSSVDALLGKPGESITLSVYDDSEHYIGSVRIDVDDDTVRVNALSVNENFRVRRGNSA